LTSITCELGTVYGSASAHAGSMSHAAVMAMRTKRDMRRPQNAK
jgi:hypothetical protein